MGKTSLLITDYGRNYYPTWSPDGQKIAFVSDQDGNGDIYVINADVQENPFA